jgi:hypothetical protein
VPSAERRGRRNPEVGRRRPALRRGAGAGLAVFLLLSVVGARPAAAACAGDYIGALRQVAAELKGGASPAEAAEQLRGIALRDAAAPALDPIILGLEGGDAVTAERQLESLASTLEPRGTDCASPYDAGAKKKLAGVYRSPAFANLDHPPPPNWVQQIVDAIGAFLQGLSGRLGEPLTLALGLGLLSLLAALTAWRLGKVMGFRRQPEAGPDRLEPAGVDPDAEWGRALGAATSGDFREAVRRAFRSALLSLSGRGRLAVDPAWTTAELLERAGGDPELLPPLAAAAGGFDIAWYSGRPVTGAEWEAIRGHCRALRVMAGDRGAAR